MRTWLFCCLFLSIALPALSATPADFPGLLLWLRADKGVQVDAQGLVTRWEDQSGNGYHFAAADPAAYPSLAPEAVNRQPAIRFDGVRNALTLVEAPIPLAGKSVFAVVKWDQVKTYSFALGLDAGTDGYLRMHGATSLLTGGHYPLLYQNSLPSPKTGYAAGDGRQIFHNNLRDLLQWNVYAITDNPPGNEKLKYLGMNELNNVPENRFHGEIAEVLVYDRALPTSERLRVEEYLEQRYLGWATLGTIPVTDPAGPQKLLWPVPPEGSFMPLNQPGRVIAQGVTEHSLPAGRYRLHCAMAGKYAATDKFSVRVNDEVMPLNPAGCDFVIPVGAPEMPTLARVSWEANTTAAPAENPSPAFAGPLYLERLSSLLVTVTSVDKILYAPKQDALAGATVRNYAAEPLTADIRFSEITGLADSRVLGVKPVTVPAGGTVNVTLPFNVGTTEYGRELLVEIVRDGQVVEAKSDAFSVADNLWKVAVGGQNGGSLATTAGYSDATIAKEITELRAGYCNWFEKDFWAPDDWGLLTTAPGASWYSGQARRHENTEKMLLQVKTAHALGIKAITYGKCMAGGLPGWELARTRPQWFTVDAYGRTIGRPADVWDLEHWQEDNHQYHDFKYDWTYRWVDLRRLDALDYGIDQLIASTKQFGWDGVRYDSGGFRAHFVPLDGKVRFDGVDSYNARNMRRTKERMWNAQPGYLFGFNTNDPVSGDTACPLLPTDKYGHEFREMMAGGGLWMFEGMRDKPDFWGRRTYKTWSDYARDMATTLRTLHGYGGQACCSYGDTELYKFVIGTMVGCHDYVGEHLRAKGSENWGVFLTRWSQFLWDPRLRALPDEENHVIVQCDHPLWYKGFSNELVVSPTKRYVIIHLLNPPVHDEVAKTKDELPAPVVGSALTLIPDHAEQIVNALFIAPGTPNRAEPLPGASDRLGEMTFSLPRIDIWGMAIVELAGKYTVPTEAPAFTEPLSKDELAEMERCKPTFNVPVADNLLDPTPDFDPAKAVVKDFGAPKVAMPAGLRVGGGPVKEVLVVKGFYHYTYRLPEALHAANVHLTECTTRDLPKDYADLAKYDIIVLADMGAESWTADGQQRLADYARAGGRLVILGGPFTLGQGFFKGTALEAVLPVEVRAARDVYQFPTPPALGKQKGQPLPGSPRLFYYHAVTPRPDARVLLWAGDLPIAYERSVGQGTTAVFAGTTMGEATDKAHPAYWTWDGWPGVLGEFILGGKR